MYTKLRLFIGIVLVSLILGGCAIAMAAPGGNPADPETVLEFDVAEDMFRFVFDEAPVFEEDGYPAYGNSFITQGYIYPKGTITCDENGCTGVNADGSPEFPDLVLGEWTCRGWFVGDGAHSTSGPMVITTQVYNFGEEYGEQMLITDGYELADVGVAIQRAITGGTGEFAGARGEFTQTFLGFNTTEGVSLRLSVNLQGKSLSLDDLVERANSAQ